MAKLTSYDVGTTTSIPLDPVASPRRVSLRVWTTATTSGNPNSYDLGRDLALDLAARLIVAAMELGADDVDPERRKT